MGNYQKWETEMTQILGYYRLPHFNIKEENATKYVNLFLSTPQHWKTYLTSSFNQTSLKAAAKALFIERLKPAEAAAAIAANFAWLNAKRNGNTIFFKFEGCAFEIKISSISTSVFFTNDKIVDYIKDGKVGIPSVSAIAALAVYAAYAEKKGEEQ